MSIAGLPLHPLVVHGAVVLAPLAALIALAYGTVPRWRWALRHVALLSAIVAAGSVQLAAMTGDALAASESPVSKLVHLHETWAGRLQASAWILAAAVVVAWWVTPHRSPIPNNNREAPDVVAVAAIQMGSIAVMTVAAVATLVLVVLTGHAGAEAVWAG